MVAALRRRSCGVNRTSPSGSQMPVVLGVPRKALATALRASGASPNRPNAPPSGGKFAGLIAGQAS